MFRKMFRSISILLVVAVLFAVVVSPVFAGYTTVCKWSTSGGNKYVELTKAPGGDGYIYVSYQTKNGWQYIGRVSTIGTKLKVGSSSRTYIAVNSKGDGGC